VIPVVINLGPFPIYSFGLMMALGFFASWRMLAVVLQKSGEGDPLIAERIVFWAAIGGIVGARIFHVFSNLEQFFSEPLETIFSGAGFVWYGGFVGGTISVIILLYRQGLSIPKYADYIAPSLAVGYAVGRIGCHLSGDGDYGIQTNLPWAVSYSLGVVPTLPGELVHPTSVYETVLSICIAYVLVLLLLQTKRLQTGVVFFLYLALSSISRFLIEFIRREPVVLWNMTQAQIISIIFIVLSGIMLLFLNLSNAKNK
jgi:phosphatidylglycerol---prolipoprotein diacylglyceryl transferase